MKKPEVDILMATYHGEKYLETQIYSILNQSFQDFRLLICDDHSKDRTSQLLEEFSVKYPDKIVIIKSEKNLGAKGNFSYLMQHAEANYIMFADQDDFWMKEKIEKTLNEMKRLENVHGRLLPLLVHSDLTVVDQDCAVLDNSFWKYSNLKVDSYQKINRFLVQNVVTGCTMMINQNLCKLSFPIPAESFMHDWWIALVASAFGKIGLVNEPTILYRQHSSNTLGAKKFGSINFLKEGFKKLWNNDQQYQSQVLTRLNQAKILLMRYSNQLSLGDKQIINDYIQLNHASWLKKRIIVLKHGLFRSGFLRNFVIFFIKLTP